MSKMITFYHHTSKDKKIVARATINEQGKLKIMPQDENFAAATFPQQVFDPTTQRTIAQDQGLAYLRAVCAGLKRSSRFSYSDPDGLLND